jgi:hypothetical protein
MPSSNPLKKLQKSLHEELLYTVLKGEKVHNSYTIMQITFFVGIFLQLFQWIRNQHQILRFLIPISK